VTPLKKRLLMLSMLAVMLLTFVGCTSVHEVAVDPTDAKFDNAQDLSLYIVEDQKEEKAPVPLDPKLEYIDTTAFSRMIETTSPTSSARKSYDQAPSEWSFVLVDARPSQVYNEGHINGAINIPDPEFDKYKHLLPANKDQLIIFYCGGLECPLSAKSATKAKALGYTNVKVYQEGIPAWKAAGNYVAVTPDYVKDLIMESYVTREDYAPFLIIDARPYSMYFDEHIPNAIQMDDTMFAQKYLSTLPSDKNTEIVVYCGGFSCGKSHSEANILVANGYKNIKVLAGGVPSWKAAGLPTFGMKSTGGSFNVAEGQVNRALTPTEFTQKLEAGNNLVVIDVRTAEERSHGAIKGSIHIPDSEIHADPKAVASKLPKDKNTTILIHCASGARAAGVVNKIADLGYPNTYYLNNAINIQSDGSYSF